jgi:hypothetical protein
VLQPAFEDSLRLRLSDAFSGRTTELFEEWIAYGGWTVSLLLELATIADHPWNADGMHARLSSVSMPERDLRWSLALNEIDRGDDRHGFYVLAEWCASPEAKTAGSRTRELAALALAWCLTCSNRPVRDTATKALSHLMLVQADLLAYLAQKLKGVDDNYVLERVWAAAFGACSHDPSGPRLQLYARLAWQSVFSTSPRKDLLLRDYARAVVELAVNVGADLDGVDVTRCKPPYAESGVDLKKARNLTAAAEDKLSEGAQRIVSSCSRMGDFGDYEIKPTVREITTIGLNALPIASKESAFRHFRASVLDDRMDRVVAFHELEEHLRLMRMPQMVKHESSLIFEPKMPSKEEVAQAELLEKRLLALLSPDEIRSFHENALPWLTHSHTESAERVDVQRCATWVSSASDNQVDKLSRTLDLEAEQAAKNLPGYLEMLETVLNRAPPGLSAPLAEFNQYSRHALNSFVHSGIHPLRRARDGFPVVMAATLVRFSNGLAHFAYRMLANLSGSQRRMDRVTHLYVDFKDCVPMAADAGNQGASATWSLGTGGGPP